MRITGFMPLLLGIALVHPIAASAQQQPRTRADSLELEIQRLKARMDSLEQAIQRLLAQGQDTATAGDELAALRARARVAAGPRDTTRRTPQPSVSRTRNLNRLNPEISMTGDVRLQSNPDMAAEDNVAVREFEFSIQSVLDPFASTKVFLTFEDGAIDLEEGYLYWTGLPGHLRVDLGRLRQQVGELNRFHLHALPETEYPLVYREYFGEEGLIGDGLRVFWLVPTSGVFGVQELTLEGTVGNNEVLFDGGNRASILGHLNNFFELSPAVFVQVGGTAVYGKNPDIDLETLLVGGDVRVSWRPPSQAQYRSFTLRAEGYFLDREFAGLGDARFGGFLGAEYQVSQRLFLGTRADYVEPIVGDRATWGIAPHLTWWQSEWAYLRAEWQHEQVPALGGGRDGQDRLSLQVVWAVGPHKHETY